MRRPRSRPRVWTRLLCKPKTSDARQPAPATAMRSSELARRTAPNARRTKPQSPAIGTSVRRRVGAGPPRLVAAPHALAEFEASHRRVPNRFRSFSGAARAAELAGDREKAKAFYAKPVTLLTRPAPTAPNSRPPGPLGFNAWCGRPTCAERHPRRPSKQYRRRA